MPKNLMPVIDICSNPLSEAQGHGSMLVAQEIRVFQCELEASLVGRHGKDHLSSICDPGVGVLEEDVAVVRDVATGRGFVPLIHFGVVDERGNSIHEGFICESQPI